MKKLTNYLIVLTLAVFTFTSCEDVPSPFGTVAPPKSTTSETQGTGTESDPFNIAAAVEKCKEIGTTESSEKYYVKGIAVTEATVDVSYGNISFNMADNVNGTVIFKAFQVAGSDGKKLPSGFKINIGDEVIVYGPIYNYSGNTPETAGKSAAYIVTVNGKKTQEGGSEETGEAKGTGTESDPFNIAAAIAKCKEIGATESTDKYYIKGIVTKEAKASGGYGNITFDMGDTKDSNTTFKAYQVAGSDGEKLADGFTVNAGDEVVVYGPIYNYSGNTPETAGKSVAQIVTINGKKTSESGSTTPDEGETKKVSVAEFLAASESTSVWYQLTGTVTHLEDGTYNNSTKYGNFDLVDETGSIYVYGVVTEKGGTKGQFADLMAAKGIKDGCKITIIGNRGSYKGTAQVVNAYFVSVEGGSGDNTGDNTGDDTSGGSSVTSLTNGDFETWADGLPTGWKSASSASSATLSQSTDAHGGTYSCNVNGNEGSNKRLASQEITLAAGSYTFSFWAKATSSDASQARPGYVPVTNGSVGSYAYGDYTTLTTSWQQISYDFTLGTETTVCLIVMNPKKSNYSSGKDILIDDATLTKK